MPKIRPAEFQKVGDPVTLAFLWCNHCLWEIDQAQLDKPPWSGTRNRYGCPGCGRAVTSHIHGPAWRACLFKGLDSTAHGNDSSLATFESYASSCQNHAVTKEPWQA